MSYFNKFFGIYGDEKDKILYLLNKKINLNKKKRPTLDKMLNNLKESTILAQKKLITASIINQKAFGGYKNKYQGRDVVLVGAGPTLNNYIPIENAIHVGCNRVFLNDKIKFDYLFVSDKGGIEEYYDEFINYKKDSCIKFVGDQWGSQEYQVPHSILNKTNVKRYKHLETILHPATVFTLDIDCEPLGNFSTVSLQAMQFILFTNPKRIYLVGMDTNASTHGYFKGKAYAKAHLRKISQQQYDLKQKEHWTLIKPFIDNYYPETEIISINPVGLKGLFKDIYTSSSS